MSYDIIYSMRALTVNGKILPFVKAGSNNLYEIGYNGRETRVRQWYTFNQFFNFSKKFLYDNVDEIIKEFGNYVDEQYRIYRERDTYEEDPISIDDYKKRLDYYWGIYRYGNRNISYKSFISSFKSIVRNAVPLNEYNKEGYQLSISRKDDDVSYIDENNVFNLLQENDYKKIHISCYSFGIYDPFDKKFKRMNAEKRTNLNNRENIEKKYIVEVYAIDKETKNEHFTGYFKRFTKYGYIYKFYGNAKRFSEKRAKQIAKKIKETMYDRVGKVKKIEEA